ncbi:hypothetical protein K2X33_10165, partial [bacterium]|nr:hypothetical protein [bacterium]
KETGLAEYLEKAQSLVAKEALSAAKGANYARAGLDAAEGTVGTLRGAVQTLPITPETLAQLVSNNQDFKAAFGLHKGKPLLRAKDVSLLVLGQTASMLKEGVRDVRTFARENSENVAQALTAISQMTASVNPAIGPLARVALSTIGNGRPTQDDLNSLRQNPLVSDEMRSIASQWDTKKAEFFGEIRKAAPPAYLAAPIGTGFTR